MKYTFVTLTLLLGIMAQSCAQPSRADNRQPSACLAKCPVDCANKDSFDTCAAGCNDPAAEEYYAAQCGLPVNGADGGDGADGADGGADGADATNPGSGATQTSIETQTPTDSSRPDNTQQTSTSTSASRTGGSGGAGGAGGAGAGGPGGAGGSASGAAGGAGGTGGGAATNIPTDAVTTGIRPSSSTTTPPPSSSSHSSSSPSSASATTTPHSHATGLVPGALSQLGGIFAALAAFF